MSISAKLTEERSAFNASMTTTKGIIAASLTEEVGAFNAFIDPKPDNAAGMYDLVNNDFLVNSGTGTFITGQEI